MNCGLRIRIYEIKPLISFGYYQSIIYLELRTFGLLSWTNTSCKFHAILTLSTVEADSLLPVTRTYPLQATTSNY